MFLSRKIDRHLTLFGRMAQAVGADLGDAVEGGRLSSEGLRLAALRCTACTMPEACALWLDGQGAGADAAPDYCRNAGLLADLAEVAK